MVLLKNCEWTAGNSQAFPNNGIFFVILTGKMKIQEKLVWDKQTSYFISYVDFGDAELNYAPLQKSIDIAILVFVFLL